MQQQPPASSSHPETASTDGSAAARGRLLLVEPDALLCWSLKTYLQRWFTVDTVNSSAGAQRLAAQQTYVAAIVSDGLSAIQTAALGRLVAEHNSAATLVGMVAGPADGVAAGTYTVQLEKPFELSRLARLLGVSEREISSG